jgi:hypothetical protein
MVLAGRVISQKPPVRRVCAALAATVAVVVVFAAPLRGLADITGEVARVEEIEHRTASAYDAAVARFRSGRIDAKELAGLAETIASELQSSRTRLASIANVPHEHQTMLAEVTEYARLREESWQLRARGLRAGQLPTLQKADIAQSGALAALSRTGSAGQN